MWSATRLRFVPGWMSSLVTLLLLPLFVYLGSWQYYRMTEKEIIEARLKDQTPIAWGEPAIETNFAHYRYRTLHIQGQFLQDKDILLDNQTFKGQVGYRVFTPFLPLGTKQKILLIDRGWIPASTRSQLPALTPITGPVILTGILNKLSPGITLKEEGLPDHIDHSPIRLQKIPFDTLSGLLGGEVYPFILQLTANSRHGYVTLPINLQVSSLRHLGYAVQWFAMALAVLIYYVIVNFRRYS